MVTGDAVRAYSQRAAEYADALGRIEHAVPDDREFVRSWAGAVVGLIIDVGCGPGQWTDFLRTHGAEIEGLDPVAAFIESAQSHYPSSRYRVGRAQELGVEDQSLGGILAWYSLIHIDPSSIDEPFAEFARALKPGGSLLLGFFDGEPGEPFAHAVVTAYFWSPQRLAERLKLHGFSVVETVRREDQGSRPHTAIVAVKTREP